MGKVNTLLQISTEGLYDHKNPLVQKNILEAIAQARETQDLDKLGQRLADLMRTVYNINAITVITPMRVPAMVRHEQVSPESLPRFRPRAISDSENTRGRGIAEIAVITAGWINTGTLKMGGVFSELPVYVLLSDQLLNWTDEEIGVAYLHEIGHYMDYVIMAACQFRSFGIVESLVRGIRGSTSVDECVTFVQNVAGDYGFKITDVESLKLAGTDEALRLKLFKDIQVSNPMFLYGSKNSKQQEYAADEFPAGIFGARVAAVALSKLVSKTSHPAYRGSVLFYGRTAVATALLMFGAASAMLPVAAFGAVMLVADQMHSTTDISHPNPITRLQRFRTLLLADAKNPELTRDQVTQLNEDIGLINAELTRLNGANVSGLEFLLNIFSPDRRVSNTIDAYDAGVTELQNNPIFLRAAQLRQIKE